ncbi:MAG TPA: 3-phosphoglycerate dehydrogenase [Candidatus Cloacimonas acidaminovorans]|nr:3-phosphoglycerate dehydrogenase [Candidatus Cloacimonas acidaminovorans]HRS60834.1 3-phosphoglycerate dehydrogenase [Candidatus Cloacimonas sp.]HOM79191.1 3-phosphoglycerate dehydrogenase [Candidatus Cloacimonas acidaminovorans]HOS07328.1 3-phosphoglycerate dehydrogenase [Candidatus Cloacimonas acidaminovorans]HOT38126.1 3-phosphoglycerate dehydrogenase [Candidatus Cloacimonas acidaminovorans]
MPKVLIATEKPFAADAVQKIKAELEKAGYEYSFLENYTDKSELHNALADAEAVIIRSDIMDEEAFNSAPKLKIVVRAGAGYDNIDLKAATAHNVVAMNTPGQNSNAVAELAIGMMIYIARNKFNGKSGTELSGKILTLYGFGWVARYVAKIAKGIGMDVYAYDPYLQDYVMLKEGVKPLHSVEDVFKLGDYISLHIPATEETKKCVNWNLLSLVKDDAVLVNTARKEIIDEEALLKVFAEKKKFRYVSDVAPDNSAEILELYPDRVFFTPKKMGAQTSEANTNAGIAAAKQIIAFFEKGDTTYKVN